MCGRNYDPGVRPYPLRGRWIREPQSMSNKPVGLGFPHRAGRCRPGGSPLSSPACGICRFMEGIMIRGWDPILPGWCGLMLALWLLEKVRKKSAALAWHGPMCRARIGQYDSCFYLKCKASSNAGFMDIRDRLGIVGHAPHTVATTRRGMRPGVSLVVSPTLYAWGKAAETLWIARP